MRKQLGGKGKVAIQVGSLTALNAKERGTRVSRTRIKDSQIGEIVVEDVDQGRRPGGERPL